MMQWIALALVGIGIGILTGFSASPVVGIVLTSLIAAAATVTALLGQYSSDSKTPTPSAKSLRPNALPLALLVLSILLGSLFSMVTRVDVTVNRQQARLKALDMSPPETLNEAVAAWVALGLEKDVVVKGVFENYLGIVATAQEKFAEENASAQVAGLMGSLTADACDYLQGLPDAILAQEMSLADSEQVAAYAQVFSDPDSLREIVRIECTLAP